MRLFDGRWSRTCTIESVSCSTGSACRWCRWQDGRDDRATSTTPSSARRARWTSVARRSASHLSSPAPRLRAATGEARSSYRGIPAPDLQIQRDPVWYLYVWALGLTLFLFDFPLLSDVLLWVHQWFLGSTRLSIPNGISFGSAVFAQLTAESPYTLQWAPLSPKTAPSRGGSGPHLIPDSCIDAGKCPKETEKNGFQNVRPLLDLFYWASRFFVSHYSFLFGSVRQIKLAIRQLLGARIVVSYKGVWNIW